MSLYMTSIGSGTPVLLLHSSGMSSRQWRKLSERLATTHRVLSPDLLGSGENPLWPAEEPFIFPMDVEAIAEVATALSTPFHLVGHSYGGLLALFLARQMPSQILSLSVYDPVTFGVLYGANDPDGLADLAKVGSIPVFQDQERGGGEEWLEAFIDYWNGPGSWRAMPMPTRAAFLRVGRKVFGEVSSLMTDRTTLSAYTQLTAPTLLLSGELSPVAAQRVVALLQQSLPNATLERIKGAGHMGPITHTEQVNRLIEQHINKNQK
jgi:pimeloyl-ACP methyl ester carboxylesterase